MPQHLSSMSSFYSINNMEEQTSHLEKTAIKLLPILDEVEKRMIDEKQTVGLDKSKKNFVETLDSSEIDTTRKAIVTRK